MKSIQNNFFFIPVSVFFLTACGDITNEVEGKLNDIKNKTESVDSLLNKETEKVKNLDTLIDESTTKVDEITNKEVQ